MKWNPVFR